MAMILCHECNAKISSNAKACPQCGAEAKKKTSTFTWVVGGFIVWVVAMGIYTANVGPTTAAGGQAKTPMDPQKEKDFQTVLAGARRLKDAMKKPESFELIDAMMINSKIICYQYRARNSFNDRRTEYYVVSDTVSSGKNADWNRHCAGKSGVDFTYARAAL